jgi:hypothetical protein
MSHILFGEIVFKVFKAIVGKDVVNGRNVPNLGEQSTANVIWKFYESIPNFLQNFFWFGDYIFVCNISLRIQGFRQGFMLSNKI